MKEKFIDIAREAFNIRGVRSVTMNDIAREAGASKKTLYEYFSGKDELVLEAMKADLDEVKQQIEEITNSTANPIIKMLKSQQFLYQRIEETNIVDLTDIRRFYPDAFKYFETFKDKNLYEFLLDNLNQGISEGLYRPDLEKEILATYRLNMLFSILMNSSTKVSRSDLLKINKVTSENFLQGLLSDLGRNQMKEYIQQQHHDEI